MRQKNINMVCPSELVIKYFGLEKCGAGIQDLTYNRRRAAYCKYCYQPHTSWALSDDHFDQMCWECLFCNHFTADEILGAN